jgi:hypothetical protein
VIITQFGNYVFPQHGCADEEQFHDSRVALAALPVADGSFDHLGDDSPKAGGTVTHKCLLVGATFEDLDDEIDDFKAGMNQGRQPLYFTMRDGTVRWTWAKKVSISLPSSGQRRLLAPAAVTFQVADPYLYSITAAGGPVWGSFIWGLGVLWGTGGVTVSFPFAGLSTVITVTNQGNANALAAITASCSAMQTAEDVNVARWVGGAVQWIQATRVIAAGKALVWDCRAYSVEYDGADDYANFSMGANQVEWLHLEPGDNTIRITCANAGDAGTIVFHFYPTFH